MRSTLGAAVIRLCLRLALPSAGFLFTSDFSHWTKSSRGTTFYKDILPILQDHCQSCHRPGEVAPMPLVTYDQTRPWAPAIAKAVQSKMMPPWFADPAFGRFANDPSLTDNKLPPYWPG